VKPDTLKQYLSYLNQMELITLDLKYDDVQEKLKPWYGKPWAQNYAYSSLRVFLNFCMESGYIDRHPLIRKKVPNKTRPRDRVLSDEEMGRIWRCTDDSAYGRILRLLILTGQRRSEVRNLTPANIADGLITFDTKGDQKNVIPITPLMEPDLAHIPFKFNNWAVAKERFDRECGVSFRNHDLRRTLATKLAIMGCSFEIIERVLGHARHGIPWTYNRHTYLPEVKQWLLKYEAHIRTLAGARA
jgi:integrase